MHIARPHFLDIWIEKATAYVEGGMALYRLFMFTDMHYVDTTPISQSEQEQMRWEGPCTLTRHWRHCDAFMRKKRIGHGS